MLCFYRCGKNEVCVHMRAMKYKLCNFGDSMHDLNVLIFAFKNGRGT